MASHAHRFDDDGLAGTAIKRLYTLCYFDNGLVVPGVQLFDAETDEEAIAEAESLHPFRNRELWDRHRLVAVIPQMRTH